MNPSRFFTPFTWSRYSKKLQNKIDYPKNAGFFSKEDASSRQMRLVIGKEGELASGEAVALFLLVDESDGVIADAKFQIFGSSVLIGIAEVVCDLLMRKNYDQAKRLGADLIDKQVRDHSDYSAFPEETSGFINMVISALENAVDECMDIPLPSSYVAPPPELLAGETGEYPGWKELSSEQKIYVIEQVIEKEIRPYIELDAGGVRVLRMVDDKEIIIAYEGSCTSCYSATGATLNAIQQVLRSKVFPDLIVTPDLSFLSS